MEVDAGADPVLQVENIHFDILSGGPHQVQIAAAVHDVQASEQVELEQQTLESKLLHELPAEVAMRQSDSDESLDYGGTRICGGREVAAAVKSTNSQPKRSARKG